MLYDQAIAFIVKYANGEWPDPDKDPGPPGPPEPRTYHQVKSMTYALQNEMQVRPATLLFH